MLHRLRKLFIVSLAGCGLATSAAIAFGLTTLGFIQAAHASPVSVSFTTSGSAGNWTYDFSVTNTISPAQTLYFFGVQTPGSISASPPNWGIRPGTWTNMYSGGSSIVYNDNWISNSSASYFVSYNSTLSGFTVHDASATANTQFNFFAYSVPNPYVAANYYYGDGCFVYGANPGFEGIANAAATPVPVPPTLALFAAGLGGLVVLRRRRKTAAARRAA